MCLFEWAHLQIRMSVIHQFIPAITEPATTHLVVITVPVIPAGLETIALQVSFIFVTF